MPAFSDRREFLRGAGIALALPWLASGERRANGSEDAAPRRMFCLANHLGYWPNGFFPQESGQDYRTSSTLKPVDTHRGDFTVFSHLDHGIKGGHSAVHSFLSGIRKEEAAGFPEKNISADQVAAEHVGSATRYPSITAGLGEGDRTNCEGIFHDRPRLPRPRACRPDQPNVPAKVVSD